MSTLVVRPANVDDAARCLEIYGPIVESTAISFETEVPSLTEFATRIDRAQFRWAWLMAMEGDRCAGYAYGTEHRARAAYGWSVEVSAYVHPDFRRRGVAQRLYRDLFERLVERGFHQAYAGVTLPNGPSLALHESVGFARIGQFPRIGFKFDRWHDVAWFHRELQPGAPAKKT